MTRVTQILDADLDDDARAAADTVATQLGTDVVVTRHALGPAGVAVAAVRLRRTLGTPGVVHAVGGKALAAAVMGTRGPIVFSPAGPPTTRLTKWVRAVAGQRPLRVVCATETARRFFVTRGVSPDACRVIRPAAAPAGLRRDSKLRERLGFDDSHRVLLAVGTSTHAANHGLAAWVASLLHVTDPSYRLLIATTGRASAGLRHLRGALLDPSIVVFGTDRPGIDSRALLAAADVALVTATGPVATRPIALAMAAGVPIVSTTTAEVSELIEDRHTALLVRDASPRDVARRVIDLHDDADLRWRLTDRARAEAFDFFTPSRAAAAWREVFAEEGEPRRREATKEDATKKEA